MARHGITSLLAGFMLLCTLTSAVAQQSAQQPAQPPQPTQQPRPNFGDDVPHSWGGLPEGAPPRQKVIEPTPAVHDIPPPRATKPLNSAQQLQLEKELDAARTRTNKLEDTNAEKRSKAATAANTAALERARKKAGNPKPKEPKPPKQ
jgi:hypothetical protein